MDYARQLGLDQSRFGEALIEHRYLDRVRTDVTTGRQHEVSGTPTFFVNDRRQDGDDDVHALMAAIRKVLSS